jgi:hypothetical protein
MVQLTNIIKTAALLKAQDNCEYEARAEHFDALTGSTFFASFDPRLYALNKLSDCAHALLIL